jgi:iron complex outermembrane receptor protein
VATDLQWQHRRGFENFIGTQTGVRGALRRDQDDRLASRDVYAQADWRATPRLGILLGVRRSLVAFRSRDDFVTAGNPDDSGTLRYASTNPVLGATFQVRPAMAWYASWGRGFETPTFDELAYRADGSAGLNAGLRPSRTRSAEMGARGRAGVARWQAALFRADTRDELVVATNAGGRSSFQNAGEARRQGAELALDAPIAGRWHARIAATLLDARYRDAFLTCAASPCPVPTQPVAAGTPLPGLPRRQLHAALHWEGDAWRLSFAGDAADGVRAANAGSARAPGFAVLAVELGRAFTTPRGGLEATLRVGNAFDRAHVGSVIVNEANGRHFEPAPGRNLLLLLDWRP